jgi:hypothetical protein
MSQLKCSRLANFDASDWESVQKAFAETEVCSLGQPWRERVQTAFLPASVRTGWTDKALWIYAVMQDADIFNDATIPNQPTWTLGDVFEIFLQPKTPGDYFEIHITPENQTLQLLWPSTGNRQVPGAPRLKLSSRFIKDSQVQSWTLREAGQWKVLVSVPVTMLFSGGFDEAKKCRFSYCRYDVTRGADKVSNDIADREDRDIPNRTKVLSSTSAHKGPPINFHTQEDWREMIFVGQK